MSEKLYVNFENSNGIPVSDDHLQRLISKKQIFKIDGVRGFHGLLKSEIDRNGKYSYFLEEMMTTYEVL